MAFRDTFIFLPRLHRRYFLTTFHKSTHLQICKEKPCMIAFVVSPYMLRSYSDSTKYTNSIKLEECTRTPDVQQPVKTAGSDQCDCEGLLDLNFLTGPDIQSVSVKLAAAALKITDMPADPATDVSDQTLYRSAAKIIEHVAKEAAANSQAELKDQLVEGSTGDINQAKPEPTTPTATTKESTDSSQNGKKLAELQKEVLAMRLKNLAMLEKYTLCLEEQKNMCGRLQKQVNDAEHFGISNLSRDLLPIADALSAAYMYVDVTQLDKSEHLKQLYDDIVIANQTLVRVFRSHGLEPIHPLHQKFDPHFHEALFQQEEAAIEPNTVVDVRQLGYKLRERVLRAALVGVSKAANNVQDPKLDPETPKDSA